MIDRKKVIKGLECHYKECEHKDGSICPYWENDSCSKQLVSDALAPLKEQQKLIDEVTKRRANNGAFD